MANGKKKRSIKKKIIIFSILGFVIVALVLVIFLGSKREVIVPVQTEKVEHHTITQIVNATGNVYAVTQVKINAEVSGEIIQLPVKEAQLVHKGDLLVKVKPDLYIAARDQSNAQLISAQASLIKAESDYNRSKGLYEKKLVSDQELELAKTNYLVQKAGVDAAKAGLSQAEESLRKTTIYSPINGAVSNLVAELAERVSGSSFMQGTEIMTVANLDSMESRIDVDENDVVLVHIGDTAKISVDSRPGKKFLGIVTEVGNAAKPVATGTVDQVVNFEVRIRFIDKDPLLRPGMSVNVDIETMTRQNVFAVPIQSVTTRMPKVQEVKLDDKPEGVTTTNGSQKKKEEPKIDEVVFLNDGGKAKMVKVKRGISDDSYVEITEGLKGGEEVISGSYKAISRELEDGSKLRIDNQQKKIGG